MYFRCASFSGPLSLCLRLLSSWQTFVIFSTDWAESRMTPSQKTAAARLVCIQWWWTCLPMLLHHSRNIYLSPDTFRCFNAIHDTMPSRIHDIETFVASLKPGNTTQCSFFHVYFHSLRADCMIVRHSPKSLVGLAQNSFLSRIYPRRVVEVGIYLTLLGPAYLTVTKDQHARTCICTVIRKYVVLIGLTKWLIMMHSHWVIAGEKSHDLRVFSV